MYTKIQLNQINDTSPVESQMMEQL